MELEGSGCVMNYGAKVRLLPAHLLLLRLTVSLMRDSELCRDVDRSRDRLRGTSLHETADIDGNAREPFLNININSVIHA